MYIFFAKNAINSKRFRVKLTIMSARNVAQNLCRLV